MTLRPAYLESASVSTLLHEFTIDADPTGLSIEFNIVQGVRGDPGVTWAAGSWVGSWSPKTGWMVAKTPTIGAAGAALPASAGEWHCFQRIDGAAILYCGTFFVN